MSKPYVESTRDAANVVQCEACKDCGRPVEYREEDGCYHHLKDPQRGCFLIAPEMSSPNGQHDEILPELQQRRR